MELRWWDGLYVGGKWKIHVPLRWTPTLFLWRFAPCFWLGKFTIRSPLIGHGATGWPPKSQSPDAATRYVHPRAALVGRRGTHPTAAAADDLLSLSNLGLLFCPKDGFCRAALTPVEAEAWDSPISGERSGGWRYLPDSNGYLVLSGQPNLPLLLTGG